MFEPGEVVEDRYEIVGALGQGGMAHVFAAQDRHLERRVALKVLRPHLTETDSERFRREIRALARLSHPGIVTIFDLGGSEHVYFAMELIEGGPFTDLAPFEVDTEPLERLLGAAIDVAETLGYVHRLGMVHRDLTPRNILLTPHGSPKVMDFGLVQLTESSRQLTRTGFTLGTPQYMAPEQATGDATGAATDLYAFGAVLYRALTGVAPFDADNDQAVLYQHVYGEPEPPHAVNPFVTPALSGVVLDLLRKDPAERPRSGYAVAAALRGVRDAARRRSTHLPLAGPARAAVYPHAPTSPRRLAPRWEARLDDGPQWPAGLAAAEGFLLAGLRSDALAVLRPADGGLHAVFELADEVELPPLFANGQILAASRDGGLASVAWPRGETTWQRAEVEATGLVPVGEELVVARRTGTLERWTSDGGERWCAELEDAAATAPVVHRGVVYTLDAANWLHAHALVDGAQRFKLDLGGPAATPTAVGDLLLLPERNGELHGFDVNELEVRWSYGLEGEVWGGPASWDGLVFAASWAQRLHCLALRSGDDVWEQPLPAPVTASPVVAGGVVWVGTEGGELLGFDAREGTPLFRHAVSASPVQASPLPVDGRLVVAAVDGTVVAFS